MTIPLLPCGSVDEISTFYRALGFDLTYRQLRPNPYIALRREDLNLHFFGLPSFDPEQSYGTCLVVVPDIGAIYESLAERMRATYGKLLVTGIPRMTRPRKRKNNGNLSGFSIVDPGGNWIRFTQAADGEDVPGSEPVGEVALSRLAQALENAVVLGESKGDHGQAAKILDGALGRAGTTTTVVDRVGALVYRAELARRAHDDPHAQTLLAEVREMPLTEDDRERLVDALATADELERELAGPVAVER
jgi:hypothetical protein